MAWEILKQNFNKSWKNFSIIQNGAKTFNISGKTNLWRLGLVPECWETTKLAVLCPKCNFRVQELFKIARLKKLFVKCSFETYKALGFSWIRFSTSSKWRVKKAKKWAFTGFVQRGTLNTIQELGSVSPIASIWLFWTFSKEYIENWDKWNMAKAEFDALIEHKSLLSKELRSDDLINVHRKYFGDSEEKNWI